MIKVIPPGAWPELAELPAAEWVKLAREGLRGTDFAAFVKRASHPLAMWVRENPPGPGGVYVHSHIFSTTDVGGQNRNADEYGRLMARRDLPSYEKFGRAYLNHRNGDQARSYGVVKKAYLNEPMGRAEVIVELNGNKEAADRNGGLVADRTLGKLASNEDVAVSQSCRIPYDTCNGCDNKAKNRAEYCCGPSEGGTCKYGGCRHNLGRVFEDGKHLGRDNPHCTFFDWSDVSDTRGADRTAFVTGKVAAADHVISGAELAERLGLVAPDHLLDPVVVGGLRALRKLAAHQARYPAIDRADWGTICEVRSKLAAHTPHTPVFLGSEPDRHRAVAELAGAGVILPPEEWLAALSGVDATKCAACFAGGIDPLSLINDPGAVDHLSGTPAVTVTTHCHWLSPTARAHGRESQLASLRSQSGVIKTAGSGSGSERAPANVVKEAGLRYLAYQAAVLAAHENSPNLLLLYDECARHNRLV